LNNGVELENVHLDWRCQTAVRLRLDDNLLFEANRHLVLILVLVQRDSKSNQIISDPMMEWTPIRNDLVINIFGYDLTFKHRRFSHDPRFSFLGARSPTRLQTVSISLNCPTRDGGGVSPGHLDEHIS
jgi:hypothetical protein